MEPSLVDLMVSTFVVVFLAVLPIKATDVIRSPR